MRAPLRTNRNAALAAIAVPNPRPKRRSAGTGRRAPPQRGAASRSTWPHPEGPHPESTDGEKAPTKTGRAAYTRRKAISEPVFSQVDTCHGGKALRLRCSRSPRLNGTSSSPAMTSASCSGSVVWGGGT